MDMTLPLSNSGHMERQDPSPRVGLLPERLVQPLTLYEAKKTGSDFHLRIFVDSAVTQELGVGGRSLRLGASPRRETSNPRTRGAALRKCPTSVAQAAFC
jgi:hypothetical protein